MKGKLLLGVATLAASLAMSGGAARGQDAAKDPAAAEQEKNRQRMEALERKVDQLEQKLKDQEAASQKAVAPAAPASPANPTDFRAYWKDGLQLESANKAFRLHFGGRFQYDFEWFNADPDTRKYTVPATGNTLGNQLDGDELRRLRAVMDGTIYENTFYKLEVDFAGRAKAIQSNVKAGAAGTATTIKSDTVQIRNAYVGTTALIPFAAVQVGHFKEPFGLETKTDDNYTTFMERGLPYAFTPDYQTGLQLSNAILDQRMTWAIGVFRTGNGTMSATDQGLTQADNGYNTTARVTGLPWYQAEKEGQTFGLVHVGAAASMRYPTGATSLEISSTPEMHLASAYVDTGILSPSPINGATGIHEFQLYEAETVAIYGPLSVQGEVMRVEMERTGQNNLTFQGAYGFISYFLSGDHRGYRKSDGVIDRVHPLHNFGRDADGRWGWGAWELAGRYSYIDLNSQNVQGGRLADVTVGLNWYLNPNLRVMVNYVRAHLFDNLTPGRRISGGDTDMLGLRFQVDL